MVPLYLPVDWLLFEMLDSGRLRKRDKGSGVGKVLEDADLIFVLLQCQVPSAAITQNEAIPAAVTILAPHEEAHAEVLALEMVQELLAVRWLGSGIVWVGTNDVILKAIL